MTQCMGKEELVGNTVYWKMDTAGELVMEKDGWYGTCATYRGMRGEPSRYHCEFCARELGWIW